MATKASTFMNMVVSLLVITLVAGFSLGFINDITKGPKAKAKLEKKIKALKLVLPEFTSNPVADMQLVKSEQAKDSVEIYPAFVENEKVGTAVIGSSEKGFSGLVKLMVGFQKDGLIQNVAVLEHKETPGLGTKMADESFVKQFRGKDPTTFNLIVKKDGGEVDALTGATISTRAFCDAVQMAYDEYKKNNDSAKDESKK
jgi:electron transport complex protein RnfG